MHHAAVHGSSEALQLIVAQWPKEQFLNKVESSKANRSPSTATPPPTTTTTNEHHRPPPPSITNHHQGDSRDRTALNLCVRWGHVEMVKFLLADPTIMRDRWALTTAHAHGHRAIVELLKADPEIAEAEADAEAEAAAVRA